MGFDTTTITKAIGAKGKLMLDWRNWLYGLFSGMIGGAATAGSSQLALAVSKGLGIEVDVLHWKQLGMVMLVSGLVSAFAFLKQSPLPPKETDQGTSNKPSNPS